MGSTDKQKIEIPCFSLAPFCFLEGGMGLNDDELELLELCNKRRVDNWVLDDLYEKPRRLAAIQFLQPKTLILGTTGVFEDKIAQLIDLFFSFDLHYLENIIFTLNTEEVLWKQMKKLERINDKIQFWSLSTPPYEENKSFEITKIITND